MIIIPRLSSNKEKRITMSIPRAISVILSIVLLYIGGMIHEIMAAEASNGELIEIDLDIFNGQDGAEVPDDKEVTLGAFTVANINNTDGNSSSNGAPGIDRDQATVPGEVDLMKMIIRKPSRNIAGVKLTLTKESGSAKVYSANTKGTEITLPHEYTYEEIGEGVTLWVEATAPSKDVRDIAFKIVYSTADDSVNATGIWAQLEAIASTNQTIAALKRQPGWSELTNPPETLLTSSSSGTIGLNPVKNRDLGGITNSIAFRFILFPPGIGRGDSANVVKFDVARQVSLVTYRTNIAPPFAIVPNTFKELLVFTNNDNPNDDVNDLDESPAPTTKDYFFSADTPGFVNISAPLDGAFFQYRYQFNALEYIRVSVLGTRPTGNQMAGSRASDKSLWHVSHTIKDVLNSESNDEFFRTTGDTIQTAGVNDIGADHVTLPKAP